MAPTSAEPPRPRPPGGLTMALEGLHHITAITADAPRNVDFYARLLGLRLVKKTVNFDQPDVYHLYYGDETGTPGVDPDVLRVPVAPRAARPATARSTRSSGAWPPTTPSPSGTTASARPGSPPSATSATCRSPTPRASRTSSSWSTCADAPLVAQAPDVPAEHALLGLRGRPGLRERAARQRPAARAPGHAARRARRRLGRQGRRAPRAPALRRAARRRAAARAPAACTTSRGASPTTRS